MANNEDSQEIRTCDILYSNSTTAVLTLKKFCLNQVFRNYCNITQSGDFLQEDHEKKYTIKWMLSKLIPTKSEKNPYVKDLNKWKKCIQELPNCLVEKIDEIHNDTCYGFYYNFSGGIFEPSFDQRLRKNLPVDVIKSLKSMKPSQLFNFWYLNIGCQLNAFVPTLDVCLALEKLISNKDQHLFLKLKDLYIEYDKDMKQSLQNILKKNNKLFEKVFVNGVDGTENDILYCISKSGCCLKELEFCDLENLQFKSKNIINFLESQADSLEILDMSNWLHNIDKDHEVVGIFNVIAGMKNLKELCINAPVGTEENILSILSSAQDLTQLEKVIFVGRTDLRFENDTIIAFLVKFRDSLQKLDLTEWINDQFDHDMLEVILEVISKMKNLKELKMYANDLIDARPDMEKYHRLSYFSEMEGLELNVKGVRGDNYEHESGVMASDVRELISLCTRYPNQKILDIHVEGFFGRYTDFQEKDSLNKIDMVTFRLTNVNENSGWICDADWKALKNIYIWEEYIIDLNYLPNYFLNNKWRPIMPQLKVIDIELRNIPFHYCSLMSLLIKSPDLNDLSIVLEAENAIIEDFDIMEFNIEMKKCQLKLEQVKLTNKCRPIIPFESFMDLIHASPDIRKVTGNFNSYEELMLKREYTVCFEDDWNLDDFPIISLEINE